MSNITTSANRAIVSVQNRAALAKNEDGFQVAEWAVTGLVAVGLVMSVLAIVTGQGLNGVFEQLCKKAVTTAAGMIHG